MADLANRLVGGRKGARILGVALLALGVFVAISLISHSPQDFPNSSRSPAERTNLGGQIGAYISYAAFLGVGYAAYVLPLLFLPIVVPVIIAAVKASGLALDGESWGGLASWLGIIGAFDVIFLVVSFLVFTYVIEE